jgi:putative transposase
MIIGSNGTKMQDIIRDLKRHTSEKIRTSIENNRGESRKEWILEIMKKAASTNSNNTKYQFWIQDNMPIEISNPEIAQQKLNYIHMNPVKAGYVLEPNHWKYISAVDYYGGKGVLDILFIN